MLGGGLKPKISNSWGTKNTINPNINKDYWNTMNSAEFQIWSLTKKNFKDLSRLIQIRNKIWVKPQVMSNHSRIVKRLYNSNFLKY